MALRPQQVGAIAVVVGAVLVLALVCLAASLGEAGSSASQERGGSDAAAGGRPQAQESGSEGEGALVSSYSSERAPSEEAARLLGSYEDEGDCVLREAGFIDLLGNAWTCTVQGSGWVDVCLVSGRSFGSAGSEVRVIHMDVNEWERAYGQAIS